MNNFTVKELKQQLRTRNLPITGLKADLINRLQEDMLYQFHMQTKDTERNSITEKPTTSGSQIPKR